MPISALSSTTIRLLGSPCVITTPVSLVKELLDNAIDAKATSVEVLISPNTVDKVEVRDNGVGIHPDDYDSLGRHGYTSKLEHFDELHNLVGASLGFRGEALASANSVGNLTITTKTPSDPVAAILQIIPKAGGVLKHRSGPAPVGTTVSLTAVFGTLPVREQIMIKDAPKTLDKIKELLRSYAMARPQLKLTFKVLQTPKQAWSYSPRRGAGINEAVLQLIGKDLASQCIEETVSFAGPVSDGAVDSQSGKPGECFVFEAFMLKSDADPSRLPNIKHGYFSVDGRPVTSSKGTMRKITSTYTNYLSSKLGSDGIKEVTGSAFIRLNIKCPKGSYDANIEPSKDEVLFENETSLTGYFEKLCEDTYGPIEGQEKKPAFTRECLASSSLKTPASLQSEGSPRRVLPVEGNQESSVPSKGRILAQTKEQNCSGAGAGAQAIPNDDQQTCLPLSHRNRLGSASTGWTAINIPCLQQRSDTMRGEPEKSPPTEESRFASDMSLDLSQLGGNLGWLRKRDNPFQRTKAKEQSTSIVYNPTQTIEYWPTSTTGSQFESAEDSTVPQQSQPQRLWGEEPTPSMTPEPAILYHHAAPPRDLDVPPSLRNNLLSSNENRSPALVPGGPYRSPLSSPPGPVPRQTNNSRELRGQLPWTPPSSAQRDQEQWGKQRYSKNDQSRNPLKQTTISFDGLERPRKLLPTKHDGTPEETHNLPCAAVFSTAKQHLAEATAISPNRQPALEHPIGNSGVVTQRRTVQNKKIAGLHETDSVPQDDAIADQEPIRTTLPSGDPRAYLLRQQKFMATDVGKGRPRKFRRAQSNLMPLQNTPLESQTYGLMLFFKARIEQFPKSMDHMKIYDKYIVEGDVEDGLDVDLGEARRIEQRLDTVLAGWSERVTGERLDVGSQLSAQLRGQNIEVSV
ncbi:hypothetical protein JX265_007844 [Neoarthrinium moseri]|uniref:DNA mismatch repair protein S5 domain-containing protein n=1 Tax=Neoarthrinium moseri TaxID=1658444 RepID=A0A9Q0AP80_9PEZI|nr:uncharacterized protein JN550_003424 [Neoarthrinium moseri]KAI1866543.1 hypothetical protein JX265_007844 [Neoarthrinium moseri]KAI1873171.1 hypothetical protein JN550_003424 [Neoarthrinium moseri]